jgi:alkylation response protein AidB-like acyl-CoA dehydrogenase
MNFAWSEEQDAFRASVRRFLAERWPVAEVRRLSATERGYDPVVWRQLAGDTAPASAGALPRGRSQLPGLGLAGLAVPEAYGGQGFSMLELSIALDELGRELAGGPFFATACLSVLALRNVATPAEQAAQLPQLASGETIAALAVQDAPGPPRADAIACVAPGGRLSGTKRFVVDAQNAGLLLVAAREPGSRGEAGVALYALDANAPGVRIEAAAGLDLTRKLAHVELDGAPALRLGAAGSAWPGLARTLAEGAIGLAAEQIGAASRCLELAVAHARERVQFGRPIGSFQAVKHRAVDALTLLELARSAAWWAAWVASRPGEDLREAAAIAHSTACAAFWKSAYECIHLHGGMGFTWEHDAHLFYRRARADRILFGDPAAHDERLAEVLGLV